MDRKSDRPDFTSEPAAGRGNVHAMPTPVERHLRWMQQRGLRPTTVVARRRLIAHTESVLGKPLLEATEDDLASWRDGLHQSPGTICAKISGLREFYRWAVADEILPSDPMRKVVTPKRPQRLPRPIPEPELELALAAAPARVKPWLFLAAYAGLRAQEIAFLQVSDLSLHGLEPHLIVSAAAAKGGKPRIVPLGNKVIGALRVSGIPSRGYVFPRGDDLPGPNKPWTISHLANRYLHGLGIGHSLHTLRHRFGTRMYGVSRDLRMVQEVLGHSNPSTTSGYVQYSKQSAVDAVRALDVA